MQGVPQALIDQLRAHEGYRQFVYLDTEGIETIGYGRNLRHKGVSLLEADVMLRTDANEAWLALHDRLDWLEGMDQVRRSALVDMAFNLGVTGLLGFKRMLAALEAGDYATAAAEALDSRWARQVGTRAETIARQIRTGER